MPSSFVSLTLLHPPPPFIFVPPFPRFSHVTERQHQCIRLLDSTCDTVTEVNHRWCEEEVVLQGTEGKPSLLYSVQAYMLKWATKKRVYPGACSFFFSPLLPLHLLTLWHDGLDTVQSGRTVSDLYHVTVIYRSCPKNQHAWS